MTRRADMMKESVQQGDAIRSNWKTPEASDLGLSAKIKAVTLRHHQESW